MEQRRLRLGDIVDDYCPRERRVTNHAVVAMIEEDVRQTRCSTCEAEHPYKGGHAPRRRKKDAPGALYKEVLAGMPDADAAPVLATPPAAVAASPDTDAAPVLVAGPVGVTAEPPAAVAAAVALEPEPPAPVEDGPVHRTLIRAQLPRVEGHKEVRQTPEFTIRQPGGRAAGNFHGGGGGGGDQRGRPRGVGQGQSQPSNRPSGGGRFAGARASNQGQGAPQGRRPSGGGFHAAQPQGRNGNGNGNGNGAGGGGGRKRSR